MHNKSEAQPTTPLPSLLWSYERTGFEMGGLSRRGVIRLADAGEITRCKVGYRTFIVADSVREFVARQVAAPE